MRNNVARFKNFLKQETPKKYAAVFAGILALCLLLELLVFNFKWLGSLGNESLEAAPSAGTDAVISGEEIKFSGEDAELNYNNINDEIKYLYFYPGGEENKAVITLSANDEGNTSEKLSAPSRTVYGGVERSRYIRLHFSGNIKNLTVKVSGLKDKTIDVGDIKLNVKVPLMFSWQRFLILSLILMLLYLLRPRSFVYKYKTDMTDKRQLAIAACLLLVQAVCFFHMIHYNTDTLSWHETINHHKQYYELVDAFKNGHVNLGDAPKELAEMENPYDTKARTAKKIAFKWDSAYYNGKYYVYFGAVPAVLMYLPYNLVTGKDLPNYIAVYILGIFVMIGILLLLWEIIKKWYKNTPFALYLMISIVFGAASVLGYAAYRPDFYLVPVIAALAFALFGLALWLSAETKDENGETKLSSRRLAVGSLCVALTAGCRPQMLITIVFGVILFWNAVFKKRALFSKSGLKPTLALCLPFVAVAAVIMSYNYARFGSPFDFGANYNLTTNDMTARGFVFGRSGLGIFSYLLQPFRIDGVFPFIKDFDVATVYQGLTLTEKMLGGVFWLFPILIPGIAGAFCKNLFSDGRARGMVCASLIMTVVIAVLDAQMAGLLTRYFTDFVWLGMIAASLTLFALYDKYSAGGRVSVKNAGRVTALTLTLSAMTLIIVYLIIFAQSADSVMKSNPQLYYTVQHLIAFWM